MRCVITGVAGFIGSHLAAAALARGDDVVGIDCLTPYYDTWQKRANLSALPTSSSGSFEFVEADLGTAPLGKLLEGADVVFHLAGQPGIRKSWDEFPAYVTQNVLATQRLLEACRMARPRRLVYASSSSVYGDATTFPTPEDSLPAPVSPYGVTKLAGEHLCRVYEDAAGMTTCALRYFTVFGPRQRPDMAIHRFIERALDGQPIELFGDGSAVRDFTFVADAVDATLRAGEAPLPPGSVLNVAGGSSVAVGELVGHVGELLGRPVAIDERPAQEGDATATGGDTRAAERLLGWAPQVDLREGLLLQIEWHRQRRGHR